jgi:hypothetical protein
MTLPGNLRRIKVLSGDSDRHVQTVSSSSQWFGATVIDSSLYLNGLDVSIRGTFATIDVLVAAGPRLTMPVPSGS